MRCRKVRFLDWPFVIPRSLIIICHCDISIIPLIARFKNTGHNWFHRFLFVLGFYIYKVMYLIKLLTLINGQHLKHKPVDLEPRYLVQKFLRYNIPFCNTTVKMILARCFKYSKQCFSLLLQFPVLAVYWSFHAFYFQVLKTGSDYKSRNVVKLLSVLSVMGNIRNNFLNNHCFFGQDG